jgi:hypothetical protein
VIPWGSPDEELIARPSPAGVSLDIPACNAFHKDYKMTDPEHSVKLTRQSVARLEKTRLRYVYAGNLPGRVGDLETRAATARLC